MKKLFAATTAVALLSTGAFAAAEIDYSQDCDYVSLSGLVSQGTDHYVATGKAVYLEMSDFVSTNDDTTVLGEAGYLVGSWEFDDEYFTISRKSYTTGAALVSDVYFDVKDINDDFDYGSGSANDQVVVIEFKENLTLTNVSSPNFKINEIRVKAIKASNGDTEDGYYSRNDEFVFYGAGSEIIVQSPISAQDATDTDLVNGRVNIINIDDAFDEFNFDFNEIYMYGRAYDGDKVYGNITNDFDLSVLMENSHADDIRFVQVAFSGAGATWKIELEADQADYVYEVVNGNLVESTLAWDSSTYAYTGYISGSREFVIAEVPLNVYTAPVVSSSSVADVEVSSTVTTSSSSNVVVTNPNTGAAGTVAVASAIALVSTLAGAAVSIKKNK